MEKGIAGLRIKSAGKKRNKPSLQNRVKKGRGCLFLFSDLFQGEKCWRVLRGVPQEKDLAANDAGAQTNTDELEFTDVKRTERTVAVTIIAKVVAINGALAGTTMETNLDSTVAQVSLTVYCGSCWCRWSVRFFNPRALQKTTTNVATRILVSRLTIK